MSKNGTIDDVVKNDPAVSRLTKGFDEFEGIGNDLQPYLSKFVGRKTDDPKLAEDIVTALYEGEKPVAAQVLAKYGIKSDDYQTTIAQFGIPRDELKKAIAQSKSGVFDSDVMKMIGATIGARYFGKAIEAEPARITNLADKIGVGKVVDIFRNMIGTLYGKVAVKAEEARLKAIKTVGDVREFAGRLYGGALDQYRSAYAR